MNNLATAPNKWEQVAEQWAVIILLYERWNLLKKQLGKMPKHDKQFWSMADSMIPRELNQLMLWACENRFYKADSRMWVEQKLMESPFILRNKQEKQRSNQTNFHLWKTFMCAFEVMEQHIRQL
jgi:hypothetical protein